MKMMIFTIVGIVSIALIGLAFAGSAHWHRWHGSPEERVNHFKAKITKELDLTEAQQSTLDRMAADALAEHERMASRHDVFKTEFIDTLEKDVVDPDDLMRLFESKKPAIDDVMLLASTHIAEFHSILTPEQRTKLIDLVVSHPGRCGFGR